MKTQNKQIKQVSGNKNISEDTIKGLLTASLLSEINPIKEKDLANSQLFKYLLVNAIKEKVRKDRGLDNKLVIQSNSNKEDVEAGLAKAEAKLTKILNKTEDGEDVENMELDDLDGVTLETIKKLEKKGIRVIYPNLKYRKPKYQNVSELLKYVESPDDKGQGIKLVIMNFND